MLAKLNFHSLKKKGNRFKGRLSTNLGIAPQVINSWMPKDCTLNEIHSLVGKTTCSYSQNRKEQVVLTRCCIGHSRLTPSYLLNNEEQPECILCNSNYSLNMF